MEKILFLIIIIAVSVVLTALLLVKFLFEKCSKETTARILSIEAQEKYYDSTQRKHKAYDYIYEYYDDNGNKHRGKIIKNTSQIEHNLDEEIPIRYLKVKPSISLYYVLYRNMAFIPWIAGIILLVLLLIYH